MCFEEDSKLGPPQRMWQNGHSDIKLAGELESFQQRIFPPKSRKRLLAKVEHAITPGMPSGIRKNAHLKRLDTPKSFISLVFNRVNAIKSAAKAALSGWITGSLRLAPSRPLLGSASEATWSESRSDERERRSRERTTCTARRILNHVSRQKQKAWIINLKGGGPSVSAWLY